MATGEREVAPVTFAGVTTADPFILCEVMKVLEPRVAACQRALMSSPGHSDT